AGASAREVRSFGRRPADVAGGPPGRGSIEATQRSGTAGVPAPGAGEQPRRRGPQVQHGGARRRPGAVVAGGAGRVVFAAGGLAGGQPALAGRASGGQGAGTPTGRGPGPLDGG